MPMTSIRKKIETMEDLLFDSDFVALSEKNDPKEIEQFLLLYPGKQDMIRDAFTLLQHMKVEQHDVSDAQIEEDWNKLQEQIGAERKPERNLKLYIWSTVAACAVVLMVVFFGPSGIGTNPVDEKDNLLSLVESAGIDGGEVQIIAGANHTNIDNDKTIVQTEDGNLLVGEDYKLGSAEIKTEYLTVVVPKGRRTTIKFSDGTMAWVNSGSKVVYPKVFNEKNREIIVDGEMYLDVAKDPSKPFIVHTAKGFDVQVLGTKFNINAYANDTDHSVVLVEGSVEVSIENSKGWLQPNQGFFVKDGSYNIKNVDVYPYICWKDGVMKLDGEPLDAILERVSRYYGVEIIVNEKYAKEKYKGKLDLKEPIETVLSNISISTPMSYSRSGDVIIIN
jgi:hypothetical protein